MHISDVISGNCCMYYIFVQVSPYSLLNDLISFFNPYCIKEHNSVISERPKSKLHITIQYRKGTKYSLGSPTDLWFSSVTEKDLLK